MLLPAVVRFWTRVLPILFGSKVPNFDFLITLQASPRALLPFLQVSWEMTGLRCASLFTITSFLKENLCNPDFFYFRP